MEEVERNFETYLEEYCRSHHISKEVAMQEKIVQEVKKYYEESKVKP